MDDESDIVTLKEIFFHRDTMANGRRYLIYHTVIATLASNLATGAFYSAFLLQFGIDVAGISILAFIPYFASLFSLLSPAIIRRLKTRRLVLFIAKLTYYSLQIGGVTLLPFICKDSWTRTVGFCLLLFAASTVNALFNPGYIDWHIKFAPERVRSKYFSVQLALNNLFPFIVSIALSVIADSVSGTERYESIIVFVRILAYVFAVIDCLVLLLPHEFPYETSGKKTKLSDVFRIPLSNKIYRNTLLIYFLYQFYISLNTGVLNAYYLEELKQSLTVIHIVNAMTGVCFLLFSGMWQRFILRKGWFRCLYTSCFLIIPAYIALIFINADNAAILFPLISFFQCIPTVGRSITSANLIYINTPDHDSSYYYSLSLPVGEIGVLSGLMVGSLVVSLFGGRVIPIGSGINYGQFLYLCQAVLSAAFGLLVLKQAKKLDPTYK